jgi:diadenosine tetraphosphatase ApaH/serine/threonine PP2A family protein phosphatase
MEALLYDVHGNLPALEAVLADAAGRGADGYVLGGDYALFGGWPRETVQRLKQLTPALWIRGNGERWTNAPDQAPDNPVVQGAIAARRDARGDLTTIDLAALPATAQQRTTLICHGSPGSDVESFSPDPSARDDDLLEGAAAQRVVFGHTHLPFRRAVRGIELVNPGAVGMPFDGDPRAAYALVHDDGRVEHRRVEYDHAATAQRLRSLPGDWTETVARRIEQARMDV